MSNVMSESKRKYTIFVGGPADTFISEEIRLRNILEPKTNDWEYIYALGEIIDTILDLRPLEHLYFQSNRDDKNSRGLIVRKS